jgi:hypothetical protein
MPLDTRWKNPQGSDPRSLHLWAQELIRELRKGSTSSGGSVAAEDVSFTPAGSISATDVQAAIQELDAEKLSAADIRQRLTGNTVITFGSGQDFTTLQAAWDHAAANLDTAGFELKFKGIAGTHAGVEDGKTIVGGGTIVIEGISGASDTVIIQDGAGLGSIHMDQSEITVQHFEVRATGVTSEWGLTAPWGGVIRFGPGMRLGACVGEQLHASSGGQINSLGNAYSIVDDAGKHAFAGQGGQVRLLESTVTLSGTPAFSEAFAYAGAGGIIDARATTFSGAATGVPFINEPGGIILRDTDDPFTAFPGDVEGVSQPASLFDSELVLGMIDDDRSNQAILRLGSDLTANRDIFVLTGDQDQTLDLTKAAAVQVFTASGTYTPTAGMKTCRIRVQAPGGGSGGADGEGFGEGVASGAGGAGEYAEGIFTAAQISASQIVTIGAVGTAGSNTGGDGGTGGTTSVGSLITAIGGSGGTGTGSDSTDSSPVAGGAGGTGGAGGSLRVPGQAGGVSDLVTDEATFALIKPGAGGNAVLGHGPPALAFSASEDRAAVAGPNYGAGARGAQAATNTGIAGAVGGAGIVIIEEFF